MKQDRIIVSLPAQLKFAQSAEQFVEVVKPLLKKPLPEEVAFELKLVLNEAFVNVVHHSFHNSAELVQILFELEPHSLKICLKDRGKGVPVGNHFPPYPKELVGTSQLLLRTIDGEVKALVEDRFTLLLNFTENNIHAFSSEELFEKAQEGGTGISLMTKLMDEVRFKYLVEEGNYLELVKRLENSV